jgi:hypothetical protein
MREKRAVDSVAAQWRGEGSQPLASGVGSMDFGGVLRGYAKQSRSAQAEAYATFRPGGNIAGAAVEQGGKARVRFRRWICVFAACVPGSR